MSAYVDSVVKTVGRCKLWVQWQTTQFRFTRFDCSHSNERARCYLWTLACKIKNCVCPYFNRVYQYFVTQARYHPYIGTIMGISLVVALGRRRLG